MTVRPASRAGSSTRRHRRACNLGLRHEACHYNAHVSLDTLKRFWIEFRATRLEHAWTAVVRKVTRRESDSRRSRWRWWHESVGPDPGERVGGGHTSVGAPRARFVRRLPRFGRRAVVAGWWRAQARTSLAVLAWTPIGSSWNRIS